MTRPTLEAAALVAFLLFLALLKMTKKKEQKAAIRPSGYLPLHPAKKTQQRPV